MCSCCCRRSSKYKYIYKGTNGNAGLDDTQKGELFSGNVWILVMKDYQISKKKTHVMTMDTSYLQSCLCSLHIPTIQCPNSQSNEQANAG
uniref:Uncharacterized protein LOC111099789 isoform X2 n=1 Tax=Crassostrea virginica TaxID=6565 RepID=A0A8B8A8M4_CRAVI|nr:uncharacterized protein LOC111099789 isoform X2 [Crassostrea virginica]